MSLVWECTLQSTAREIQTPSQPKILRSTMLLYLLNILGQQMKINVSIYSQETQRERNIWMFSYKSYVSIKSLPPELRTLWKRKQKKCKILRWKTLRNWGHVNQLNKTHMNSETKAESRGLGSEPVLVVVYYIFLLDAFMGLQNVWICGVLTFVSSPWVFSFCWFALTNFDVRVFVLILILYIFVMLDCLLEPGLS